MASTFELLFQQSKIHGDVGQGDKKLNLGHKRF